jgi:hypothetical protein
VCASALCVRVCHHSLRGNIVTALRDASVSSAQANKCVVARIDHVATSCADSACGKETYAKWSLVMLAVSWRVCRPVCLRSPTAIAPPLARSTCQGQMHTTWLCAMLAQTSLVSRGSRHSSSSSSARSSAWLSAACAAKDQRLQRGWLCVRRRGARESTHKLYLTPHLAALFPAYAVH